MLCSPCVLVELTVTSEFFWKIVIDRPLSGVSSLSMTIFQFLFR